MYANCLVSTTHLSSTTLVLHKYGKTPPPLFTTVLANMRPLLSSVLRQQAKSVGTGRHLCSLVYSTYPLSCNYFPIFTPHPSSTTLNESIFDHTSSHTIRHTIANVSPTNGVFNQEQSLWEPTSLKSPFMWICAWHMHTTMWLSPCIHTPSTIHFWPPMFGIR